MHKRNTSSTGFTIVELLIVVVVIAILAAISIVAYTNIQGRAYDSVVQNDLAQIAKKLELFRIDKSRYPTTNATVTADLLSLDIEVSKSAYQTTALNLLYCFEASASNGDTYRLIAISKSGKSYYVSHENSAPKTFSGTFSCSPFAGTLGGFNSTDTTDGPWRTWVGGN